MRTDKGLAPSELVVPTPLQLPEDEVPELVFGEPCELFLAPDGGNVGAVEPLATRYPLVDVPHVRGEAPKEAKARKEQGRTAERHGLVPDPEQARIDDVLPEQAVSLCDRTLVGRKHPPVTPVCLPAKVIELVSSVGCAALYEREVIRAKEDAHHRLGQIRRMAALAVSLKVATRPLDLTADVYHAAVTLQARQRERPSLTLAHELRRPRVPKRPSRCQRLQGLDDVGLTRGVAAMKHRHALAEPYGPVIEVSPVAQREAPDEQHLCYILTGISR